MFIPLLGIAADFLYLILYIAGANSFPRPLSAAEERKNLELLRQGDKEARRTLIEKNLRLVAHIIKKYYSTYKEQDDLISIGTIGLIKAIDSFKSEKETRLATYAARCIENAITPQRNLKSEFPKSLMEKPTKTATYSTT